MECGSRLDRFEIIAGHLAEPSSQNTHKFFYAISKMAVNIPNIRSTLRGILRYLHRYGDDVFLPPQSFPSPSKQILSMYKTNANLTDPTMINRAQAKASSYLSMVQSVETRKYLNSLDTGAENKLGHKELTKRSASRSGFQMPKPYDENDKSDVKAGTKLWKE